MAVNFNIIKSSVNPFANPPPSFSILTLKCAIFTPWDYTRRQLEMSGCSSQGPATQVIFSGIFVQPFFIVCIVFIIVPARWLYWRFVFARQFPRHQAANLLALGSGERQSFVRVATSQVSAVAALPLCLTDRLTNAFKLHPLYNLHKIFCSSFSGQNQRAKTGLAVYIRRRHPLLSTRDLFEKILHP